MLSNEMIEIVAPALLTGLMIALTHAPLGIEVLKRGIIFIDLAVAQIAGLGLVAINNIMEHPPLWVVQLTALSSALIAGIFFRKIEQIMPKYQEAIIGGTYIVAASIAILLLADHPHGGEEIQHLLSGQMLFVTWQEIAMHVPIYLTILIVWFLKPTIRSGTGFYILFALAITSSVQLVGVYVVFASLIAPALSAANTTNPHKIAWLCGCASVALGIAAAIISDLPAGPLLVISYASVTITTLILYSRKGIKS